MIVAVIQARLGSTRLPAKVLKKFCGKTVLEHVVARAQMSRYINKVVIATTIAKHDLEIVKLCAQKGICVYVGSENNVLDRYYQAAKLLEADHVVRITSDCPVIDPAIVDKVIKLHIDEKSDYTSNVLKETYPDGLDVEVFTFAALEKAWCNAVMSSEREHVTPYIRNNPKIFKLINLENDENLCDKRWTLDNKEDYLLLNNIFKALYPKNKKFGMNDILRLLNKHPELEEINSHIARNEGYLKSIKNDKRMK